MDTRLIDNRYQPLAVLRTSDGRLAVVARAVKALDPRESDERRMMRALSELFREVEPAVADQLMAGQMPSDAELERAFQAVIQPQLVETAAGEFERLGVQIGVQFDPAQVNTQMVEWARGYTYDLVKDINGTTQKVLQNALGEFTRTPGMTRGALEALIEPAFSEARASSIAVTEVTRSASAATSQYQRELAGAGITMLRRWSTLADELVCPVCGPLNGKLETEWASQFPGGPPAHPRCRCNTVLTYPSAGER